MCLTSSDITELSGRPDLLPPSAALPSALALSRSDDAQEAITKASVQRQRQSPVSPLHQHLAEGSAGDIGEQVFSAPMVLNIACS